MSCSRTCGCRICTADRMPRENLGCWTLNFLGEHHELARLHPVLLAEAEELGDHHTWGPLSRRLAGDPVAGGGRSRRCAAPGRGGDGALAADRYMLQHWHRLYGEGEIELYVGDGANAYARVDRDTPALNKSLLLKVQHMRVQTMFLRGRCAIASLDAEPAIEASALAETRRLARQLDSEGMDWSAPFAAILHAAAANASDDRSAAISRPSRRR